MSEVFYENGVVSLPEQMTNFQKVCSFMRTMGQEVKAAPGFPDDETVGLRVDLISEEFEEFVSACEDDDIVEAADAIADMLYVVYGAAAALGINADAVFNEVHRSNMTKIQPDGTVLRDANGKVQKPSSYERPNIAEVIGVSSNVDSGGVKAKVAQLQAPYALEADSFGNRRAWRTDKRVFTYESSIKVSDPDVAYHASAEEFDELIELRLRDSLFDAEPFEQAADAVALTVSKEPCGCSCDSTFKAGVAILDLERYKELVEAEFRLSCLSS